MGFRKDLGPWNGMPNYCPERKEKKSGERERHREREKESENGVE
jgi:hypothetical protein